MLPIFKHPEKLMMGVNIRPVGGKTRKRNHVPWCFLECKKKKCLAMKTGIAFYEADTEFGVNKYIIST